MAIVTYVNILFFLIFFSVTTIIRPSYTLSGIFQLVNVFLKYSTGQCIPKQHGTEKDKENLIQLARFCQYSSRKWLLFHKIVSLEYYWIVHMYFFLKKTSAYLNMSVAALASFSHLTPSRVHCLIAFLAKSMCSWLMPGSGFDWLLSLWCFCQWVIGRFYLSSALVVSSFGFPLFPYITEHKETWDLLPCFTMFKQKYCQTQIM